MPNDREKTELTVHTDALYITQSPVSPSHMYMDVESITWARAMLKHLYLNSGSYNADTTELLTLSVLLVSLAMMHH